MGIGTNHQAPVPPCFPDPILVQPLLQRHRPGTSNHSNSDRRTDDFERLGNVHALR